jgi:PAS domain S-box-containing protein
MTKAKTRIPRSIESNLLTVGLLLTALLWVVEALLDSYVFHEATLVDSLFPYRDLHEFIDRAVVTVGLLLFFFCLQRVINKHAQVDERLRQSEERFRAMVQHASDIITVLEPDGTIRYESPAIEQALDYRPEELVGEFAFDYMHPEDRGQVLEAFVQALDNSTPTATAEFRFRHKDGSWRHFEGVGTNLLLNPAMRGIVVNSRDVTERKRAEEEISRALRAKGDFMADVSHELRVPLTVLQGDVESGLREGCECIHKEILARVIVQSRRILRLVNDLQFLARTDSGTLPLDLRVVSVEAFLDELAMLAEGVAGDHGAYLRTAISGEGRVRIDAERIEQAVLALVDNAAKYSHGKQILLSTTTKSGELCIEITDRGPGIPEDEVPLIFERFHRGRRKDSQEHTGSGLGLPIARTLAEVHGGRIEVATRVNVGTKMTLCLPLLEQIQPTVRAAPGDSHGP